MAEAEPIVTVIARNTLVKGEVTFLSPACVMGRIEGSIRATDALELRPESTVVGDIIGTIVDIQGSVEGNVTASDCCRLGPSARLMGELRAANLAISEGATFVGKVYVASEVAEPQAADAPAEEPAEEPVEEPSVQAQIHVNRVITAASASAEADTPAREPLIRVMAPASPKPAGRIIKAGR